jgi:CRP/FNR family cyclic AMP-dependent transcriptional regulator
MTSQGSGTAVMAVASLGQAQQDEHTPQRPPMWGMESQRSVVRERMKLLLAAHDREIAPVEILAAPGELLLRQGTPAEQVLLLSEGTVAVQIRQGDGHPHTLAVLEAEELLGEMGLFGNGLHSADVQVLDQPARVVAVESDQLLKAMLFDADLSIELLNLISQRCLQGNELVGLLLDGIHAAHAGDASQLEQTCNLLRQRGHAIADAADRLMALHALVPRRVS